MNKTFFTSIIAIFCVLSLKAQTLSDLQLQNARATGYAVMAARNPGKNFTVYMIKWDGVNSLEYNANSQINSLWHAQAVVKGNYFDQTFNNNNFSTYSSVIVSQSEFDIYKSTGTDWWIVCSTLPSFSNLGPYVLDNGNVGIGTTNPQNKLDVNGIIHSQGVKVDMSGWSDFVFKKEYNLPNLDQVEKHIINKGHLQNIPNEEEVLKNGINLGEMNAKLLQKIEELTLYMIDINKKVNKLEINNIRLVEDNKILQAKIKSLSAK
ncbi:hypothetical protein [Flavobacterium reichenbachii]|uniref:hypothetical protein n=1 Tax=Flavobacterium reichenbachii TaxID=362418 RepID=UPI00068A6A52|nr:hypothetical protein [Flavobacterium reichenbachii]OXB15781.1 hypothetical protein B0A68_08935 [Flavobacterium reichenbachii]